MSGPASGQGGYGGSQGGGAPRRTFEERAAAKEEMMRSVRDSSQQDRRVYVGNLSYDVKWHHLKDFMRQGMWMRRGKETNRLSGVTGMDVDAPSLTRRTFLAGEVLFADVLLLPNGMSKVGAT